jgi:hypothetical protein
MRSLLFAVVALGSFVLTAPSAIAQGVCCGRFGHVIVPCPTCGEYYNAGACSPDPDGPQSAVPVSVDCSTLGGCGRIVTYVPSGACGDSEAAASTAHRVVAHAGSPTEAPIRVNAYLRNCKGEFVAVRLAIARPIA